MGGSAKEVKKAVAPAMRSGSFFKSSAKESFKIRGSSSMVFFWKIIVIFLSYSPHWISDVTAG
jgi:hypothetical protein